MCGRYNIQQATIEIAGKVTFGLERTDFSNSLETSTPGLTPDEAATQRAKGILLNEDPRNTGNRRWDGDALKEIMVAGQGAVTSVNESSLPAFFKDPAARTEANLDVLQLKLSAAVEHVTRWNLSSATGSWMLCFPDVGGKPTAISRPL